MAALPHLQAGENVPHAPFAEWVNVADDRELIVRATYQESESYHFWAGHNRYPADVSLRGEHYGIDMNQGVFSFQYGINGRWTADFAFGFTTVGWRFFNNFGTNGTPHSTTGLMDSALGLRYQISREGEFWSFMPALTFRAGAVLPGGFDESFPFAPAIVRRRSSLSCCSANVWLGRTGHLRGRLVPLEPHLRERPIHRLLRTLSTDQAMGSQRRLPSSRQH